MKEGAEAKIFLLQPSYNGDCRQELIGAVLRASKKNLVTTITTQGFSGPTHNFNLLWCMALNSRETKGTTHALFLHGDIVPQDPWWLDTLYDQMTGWNADVMSVISPIKNPKGLTSIALESKNAWKPKRYTMREIMKLPPTFTHEKLLINTGCMLVDLRKPWVENIWFEYTDKIENVDGKFVARFFPEDWQFSKQARSQGASLCATREVRIVHCGESLYKNYESWGSLEYDTQHDDEYGTDEDNK